MRKILMLINDFWRFDEYQQHLTNWHSKQDLIKELEKIEAFVLTGKELDAFKKSKSSEIKFHLDSGIGIGVSVKNKHGKWKDITDYSKW